MFSGKKYFILIFTIVVACALITPLSIQAQYWAAMPPYNVLWPLWSPALSPADPITGITVPVVTTLTKDTILPIQPALAWDPCQPAGTGVPWLLYNTPATLGGGLLYWDLYYGLNAWPPSYMLDPATGAPAPIALPVGWSVLLPPKLDSLAPVIPIGNLVYSSRYLVPLSSLLTTADIFGLPALATLPPPIF
ncbi:MAG: hypothetical protein ACMUJM_14230 [bacterium]